MISLQLILLLTLLAALFGVSLAKLIIYFDTYFNISRKTNADKQRYIANSSFYRNHYNLIRISYININIEIAFTVLLFLLTVWALICNSYKWITYSQFDCYSWGGDTTEYNFVDYFVKLIIILTLTIGSAGIWWLIYYKHEDDKLEESEKELKEFILNNIDYYFIANKGANEAYDLDNYLKDPRYVSSFNGLNIFKLGLTYDIMTSLKFNRLKTDLVNWSKETYSDGAVKLEETNIEKIRTDIRNNINNPNYYIIANYNHNKDAPLPTLNILLHNIYINIKKSENNAEREKVNALRESYIKSPDGSTIKEIKELYDNGAKYFKKTIRTYKGIYDKYYTYYIYNILITKSLIIYVLLIIIYIIAKISKYEYLTFFKLKTNFHKYGIVLLAVYYSFTTPLILFGIT